MFGAEKLPATFTYANNTITITVDTSTSALIIDEVSALKKCKEYGAIKTPKGSVAGLGNVMPPSC